MQKYLLFYPVTSPGKQMLAVERDGHDVKQLREINSNIEFTALVRRDSEDSLGMEQVNGRTMEHPVV